MMNFSTSWQSVPTKEQDFKRHFHPNNGFGRYKNF